MSMQQHLDAWSNAVFVQEGAMTREEFVSFAADVLSESESLWERAAEIQGEINMFGDAGPGALFRLRKSVDDFNGIANRYENLTGYLVTRPRLPFHNH